MKLNTGGKTSQDMENDGILRAAGWFLAFVEDAGPSTKKPDSELQFVFKVAHGKEKGGRVTQWITIPEYARDAEAADKVISRLGMFAKRLGLWDGVTPDPDIEWEECIGRDVVIQTEFNEYTGADGKLKSNYRLCYSGVYPLDHEKIPAPVRQSLGLPALAASTPLTNGKPTPQPTAMPKPQASRRVDLSNL